MYRFTHKDNLKNGEVYDIYTKDIETLEEVDKRYEEFFPIVKNLIAGIFEGLITACPEQAPVFQQIIEVINALECNEEIELNAQDATFLTAGYHFIEFQLAGKHIIVKIEEV